MKKLFFTFFLFLTVSLYVQASSISGGGGSSGTGLLTLNTLVADPQLFAVGTSGTDFAIASATDTHTFNLPNAGASARGVVSTGSQTLAGAKTFSSVLAASAGITATNTANNVSVTITAADSDETVLKTKSSTTTGVLRHTFENSDATDNFNFVADFSAGTLAFNRLLASSGRTLGTIAMDGAWSIGAVSGNAHQITGTLQMNQLTASKPICTDGSKIMSSTCTGLIALGDIATGNNYRLLATGAAGVTAEAAAITASRALASDANGIPVASATTATELGYVSGVTSAIQTQFTNIKVEDISGHIETVSNNTLYLRLNASYAYTVNSISVDCASGTADGELQIDGTPVTGCADADIDFTSTEETETCSAANSVSAGNDLTLVITDNAAALNCRFTVKTTRS